MFKIAFGPLRRETSTQSKQENATTVDFSQRHFFSGLVLASVGISIGSKNYGDPIRAFLNVAQGVVANLGSFGFHLFSISHAEPQTTRLLPPIPPCIVYHLIQCCLFKGKMTMAAKLP